MGLKFSIGAAILMAVAFASNMFFLQSALSRSYEASKISQFMLQSIFTRDRIQIALNSKQRKTIPEIRDLLRSESRRFSPIGSSKASSVMESGSYSVDSYLNLSIVLKNGVTLISTTDVEMEGDIAERISKRTRELLDGVSHGNQNIIEANGIYYVPQLLFDNANRWVGAMVVNIDRRHFQESTNANLSTHFSSTLLIGMVGTVYVLLMSFLLRASEKTKNIDKRKFVLMFSAVMGVILFWSIVWNIEVFQENAYGISKSAAADVAKHISIDPGADRKLIASYIQSFPEIKSITTTGDDKSIHVENGGQSEALSIFSKLVRGYVLPEVTENNLRFSKNTDFATVIVNLSPDDIEAKAATLLSNGLTMILVSLFITVELLILYIGEV